MNKEISLKKFSIFLSFALIIIAFASFLVVINTTPLCKVNNKECKKATCTNCQKENNQTICDDCIYLMKIKIVFGLVIVYSISSFLCVKKGNS